MLVVMHMFMRLLMPEFWVALYREGRLGDSEPNLIVAAAARLLRG